MDRFTESHWFPSTIGYSLRSRRLGTRRVQKPGLNFANPGSFVSGLKKFTGEFTREGNGLPLICFSEPWFFRSRVQKNSQETNFFCRFRYLLRNRENYDANFSFCFRHYWKNLYNIGKNLLFYKKFLKKPLSHPLHRAVQNLLELKCIALKRIHFSEGAASVFSFLIFFKKK